MSSSPGQALSLGCLQAAGRAGEQPDSGQIRLALCPAPVAGHSPQTQAWRWGGIFGLLRQAVGDLACR